MEKINIPTVDEFVNALNSAGVQPVQLAGLLQIASLQAEIESLRTRDVELQKQREQAIIDAVAPIDAERQQIFEDLNTKLAQLEQLRKGGN